MQRSLKTQQKENKQPEKNLSKFLTNVSPKKNPKQNETKKQMPNMHIKRFSTS